MTRAEAKDYLANYRRLYADLAPEKMLDALDIILAEQPEIDLENELDKYLRGEFKQTAGGNFNNYIQVARHFYELGQRRAAEMYDEIEYNRQRAQEQEGQR